MNDPLSDAGLGVFHPTIPVDRASDDERFAKLDDELPHGGDERTGLLWLGVSAVVMVAGIAACVARFG